MSEGSIGDEFVKAFGGGGWMDVVCEDSRPNVALVLRETRRLLVRIL